MNELAVLELQLKACEQKIISLQNETENLRTLLASYEREAESLKELSESYKVEIEALQKLLEGYKAQLVEQEETYKTLTQHYRDLEDMLAHLETARSLWVGIGLTGWAVAIVALIIAIVR